VDGKIWLLGAVLRIRLDVFFTALGRFTEPVFGLLTFFACLADRFFAVTLSP
jgi:hypothetical protein